MILEDPYVGTAVLAALVAFATAWRALVAPLFRRLRSRFSASEPPIEVVIAALSVIDDDELQAVGRRLDLLPRKGRKVDAAARALAGHLVDWRATFDEGARRAFLDLAHDLVTEYDGRAGPACKAAYAGMQQGSA